MTKRSPVTAVVGSDPEEPPELYRWCNILLIDPHESPPSMCRRLPPLSKCCCLQGSASASVFCNNLARLGDGGASLSIEFFPTISSVVGTCLSKKIYRTIIEPYTHRKNYHLHNPRPPLSLPRRSPVVVATAVVVIDRVRRRFWRRRSVTAAPQQIV